MRGTRRLKKGGHSCGIKKKPRERDRDGEESDDRKGGHRSQREAAAGSGRERIRRAAEGEASALIHDKKNAERQ